MNFLEEPTVAKQLYPFTLTRAIADLRVGILTIREKWKLAAGHLHGIEVPSHLLPSPAVIDALQAGNRTMPSGALYLEHPWHLFQFNDMALRQDFEWLTAGRQSQPLPVSNTIINPGQVFLEEGARVEYSLLNASTGPIYIGKNAEVLEGCMIRGPFALCEGAVVKMGARIYGATTVGPYSVAGGEIKNSVIFGFSNKAHDGYLGDSVLGEWCNLGAGTSNSNLKNNAGDITIITDRHAAAQHAGLKCGLLMGDYSRSAINTSFNTGTVVGVCCNVFGDGLTPTFIPNFSWGFKEAQTYKFEKALEHIENWKRLKKHSLTQEEIRKLKHIFDNR